VESADPAFQPGAWVVTGGYDLGMNTAGGFGQYIRVPSSWLLPRAGLRPEMGTEMNEVLVTGATGGVGSVAIAMLAKQGYRVVAATGKLDQAPLLHRLGAVEVIHRSVLEESPEKALHKQRWAAVVDTVGGPILAGAIKSTVANGWVTACGNVASPDLALTVYPFILRGISLLGIDAANASPDIRRKLLAKIVGPWRPDLPRELITTTDLNGLSHQIERTLQGQQVGRVVVDLWPDT
jgi:putative YhdH/YhfP family quinone oxidoreductase